MFILGTLVGSGSLWQWKQVQINQGVYDLQCTQQILDLYREVNTRFVELLELRNQYVRSRVITNKPDLTTEEHGMRARIKMLEGEIITFERNLANWENRKPRDLFGNLPPMPPTLRALDNDSGITLEIRPF